ncbi:hypothetical protein Dpep_2220 [Dethiosulfovibrio peptidovorans DSM 11002]|uniref:Uncharacterized protein n=1 Tax=Dethiosulfovibrio peptidovorans DSM 11002 TaxID=469381 RepID=D2Z3Y1_9BACT|nr:V-type ATP synthase subunit F [Dethiosulfovibrio peptidovorans]EFC92242.1 hypothetical protein Dpep_2220 [Dethiosulfovibrio peptidovorans DSM 11002]
MEDPQRTVVLGRRLFIDLWSLLGLEPVSCETPEMLRDCLSRMLDRDDVVCIVVEESWFDRVPVALKTRLERMEKPLWVTLPTLNIEEHME